MRRISRWPASGGLAVGCIALVAGCGGGGDSGALSPEEYRAQADGICARFDTAREAIAPPEGSDPAEFSAYLGAVIPLADTQSAALKALEVPDELRARHDEATALLDQLTEIAKDARRRLDGGASIDTVVAEMSKKGDSLDTRADAIADELGLVTCGDDDASDDTADTTGAATETGPAASTAPTEPAPTGEVGADVFIDDTQELASNLTQYGLTLQAAAQGVDAVKQRSGQLRSQIDDFDAIIERMSGYTVSVSELETRRAAVVAAGPDLSAAGRDLLAAAEKGDVDGLNKVAPRFQKALKVLAKAFT